MKVFSVWRGWRRTGLLRLSGSRSVGGPWKRWINTVKKSLRKRGLDVRQARRMVQDKSVWRRFVKGECMGHSPGDEPRP